MDKIYGNYELRATLEAMAANDRAPHAVLFYGDRGTGRQKLAYYFMELLLCEKLTEDFKPCGTCRSCKVGSISHPDVYLVPTSGKLGGYSVDTARFICNDAFIKPNNSSGKKFYLFTNCQSIDTRTQNMLLKLIEEPPDYAYFFFTSLSKTDFLPTIISRCACFAVSECSEDEAREALVTKHVSPEDADAAVDCFHGNIGRCFDFVYDERLRKNVDLTKRFTNSIINRDEYALTNDVYELGGQREDVRTTLGLLDMLMRDAAVIGKDDSARTVGCYRDGAVHLSRCITASQAIRVHMAIEKAWRAVEANVNIPFVLTTLCSDIMRII